MSGIDVALTRALDDNYWDQSGLEEQIDPASGGLRTATYGSYYYQASREGAMSSSTSDRVRAIASMARAATTSSWGRS
ncbi:MAG: hypothetical protein U5K43_08335 [Halofilum sp. (in: g-proteobacteria)]|nr:hypothetical protein [Halofilum sp. (in: g-proteobacteria)]